MKWLLCTMLSVLALLQYRLWVGDGSLAEVVRLTNAIEEQEATNRQLRRSNEILAAEVSAFKSGTGAVEERAREDLGMIRSDETFYLVVEPETKP